MATRPASKLNLQELGIPDEIELVDKQARQSIENMIDDTTTASTSTWSSEKITDEIEDKTAVTKTASGNPITFDDGADAPLVKCVTEIQGSQDLHGYDKPWVGGAGKNKLQNNATSQTINTVVFTVNTDGTIVANGTASANTALYLKSGLNGEDYNGMVLSGCAGGSSNTYYLAFGENSSPYREFKDTGDGVDISGLESKTGWRFYIYIASGTVMNNVKFYPMVRTSGTSATWEPYSNICPITAYTEGEIEVRGKNMLPTIGSSAWEVGTIGADGADVNPGSDYTRLVGYCSIDSGTNIVFSGISPTSASQFRIFFYDVNKTFISYTNYDSYVAVPNNAKYYRIRYTTANVTFTNPQIEYGTTSTDYEPYTSTTYTTTYPSAIYRGSEDCVNGKVTITHKKYTPTSWSRNNDHEFYTYYQHSEISTGVRRPCISDKFRAWNGTESTSTYGICFINTDGALRINTFDAYSSAGDMMAAIGDISFVCDLATPTTSSVTPTNLPIKSLLGYNHIESTTGDMEIEYITEDYQPLVDLIEDAVELPAVTSLDDGKVLTVVDGKWVAASLPVGQNIQY